ncbi:MULTISPECIES: TonB-dependent receptor [Novosphingobium]|jgi:outer membrane receptor protein involved in Fe transport|uniref:TonB-dependent receptor n=1 Tax=Novosphingobium TaxID=165696 RepID=UPI0022F29AB5|nr:TonB-dependent receptor [Novosphingobium resinovorum]
MRVNSSRLGCRRSVVVALLGSSAIAAAQPALAQGAPAVEEDGIILVTAQKRTENLQDVPIAITALGGEKLRELQVKELQDAVKNIPSLTIQTTQPGFSQVYFRGVASGENANHSGPLPTVGTYLDEMPITTIQGALDIHAYDIARIEALAGPQGTLYGASSMAGTIKIVTNKPDYSGTYGAVDMELNSVAHGDVGGVAQGFLNFKLSDRSALRVVGWYRHDGGYIDNVAGSRTYPVSGITQTNADLVEKNYNDVDTYGARMALGIELDDDWTITPTLMGQVQKVNGSFAQERSSAVSKKLQTVQYNPESSKDEWYQAALTIEGKIGNWDLVATGGVLNRKDRTESDYSDYSYFYDALYGSGAYLYDNAGDLVSPNQYIKGRDKYRRQFGELRISSPQENRLRLIAGLFAQRQVHQITQNYIIDGIADAITVPGTESDIWLTRQRRIDRDYAAFGELSFDITDQLTATGGLRVYKYKNSLVGFFGYSDGYSSRTGVAACFEDAKVSGSPCTNLDAKTSDTGSIYKANLTYKLTPNWLVYATWSRGFRPGGINRRGGQPPYAPDTLDNYEFGWKSQMGAFHFNYAMFREDWSNIQLSFLGENGLTLIRNAGEARIYGVEFDMGYRKAGLTLNASGSYNDAKITKDFCLIANATFDCSIPEGENTRLAQAGTHLPITARFKANALARYEFPIGGWTGHVQGAVNYIGKRRSDLRDAENAIKGGFGAYTTADFSLGIKNDVWRFEIYANNLFDSNGVINSSVQCLETTCGDPLGISETGGVFYDYVIRPRVIGLKVGRDF